MVKILSLDYIQVMFNTMKVWYLFYYSLESTELVNQILPQTKQIDNDDNPLIIDNDDNPLIIDNEYDYAKLNDKNWSSITVKEGLFKEMRNELILNNYPHVQFIHIQERSFENIFILIISNLPKLKFLIFEDKSFSSTSSLILSSIF